MQGATIKKSLQDISGSIGVFMESLGSLRYRETIFLSRRYNSSKRMARTPEYHINRTSDAFWSKRLNKKKLKVVDEISLNWTKCKLRDSSQKQTNFLSLRDRWIETKIGGLWLFSKGPNRGQNDDKFVNSGLNYDDDVSKQFFFKGSCRLKKLLSIEGGRRNCLDESICVFFLSKDHLNVEWGRWFVINIKNVDIVFPSTIKTRWHQYNLF